MNNFANNSMHLHTSSCSAVQATIDKHTLTTMTMYDHSYGITLSPMLYVFYFSIYSMPEITLDRLTSCAFTFLSTVHDTILNTRSSGPPLTLLS